jgi:hypothetical protein
MIQARHLRSDTTPGGADARAQRPQTFYVDFAEFERTSAVRARSETTRAPGPQRVSTVEAEVAGLRSNVRDTARAVLTWLSSVTQHDNEDSLDTVLDRCLRPGPDASKLNYAALAEEINRSLGVDLSAKRVQTAIRHLRGEAEPNGAAGASVSESPSVAQRFEALSERLRVNHDALLSGQEAAGRSLGRSVAHDVLCALRNAAGRLIENGFGEGIPDRVDLDATRDRFLAFVHGVVRRGTATGVGGRESTLRVDLGRLLSALHDYDASTDADMQLVVTGAAVVGALAGPGSLPGLMARLNVLMVGRPMLETDFFVAQMLELADAAGLLIGDTPTRSYMGWVRNQPEDRQTPSPNRVRSYCLNNAATHILQRLVAGELVGGKWFETAQHCFDTMKKHDRGFKLLWTTEAIMLSTLAELTGSDQAVCDFFERLGSKKSLDLLADLRRYDNSDALNRLVRTYAVSVHLEIKGQLLVLN